MKIVLFIRSSIKDTLTASEFVSGYYSGKDISVNPDITIADSGDTSSFYSADTNGTFDLASTGSDFILDNGKKISFPAGFYSSSINVSSGGEAATWLYFNRITTTGSYPLFMFGCPLDMSSGPVSPGWVSCGTTMTVDNISVYHDYGSGTFYLYFTSSIAGTLYFTDSSGIYSPAGISSLSWISSEINTQRVIRVDADRMYGFTAYFVAD